MQQFHIDVWRGHYRSDMSSEGHRTSHCFFLFFFSISHALICVPWITSAVGKETQNNPQTSPPNRIMWLRHNVWVCLTLCTSPSVYICLQIPLSPSTCHRQIGFVVFGKRRKSRISPARLLIPPLLLLNAELTEGGKSVCVSKLEDTHEHFLNSQLRLWSKHSHN